MYVSLYGLGLALLLFVGAVVTRIAFAKVFAKADETDARTLDAAALAEKRRVRNAVMMIFNVELVAMPVIGYLIGHFALDMR